MHHRPFALLLAAICGLLSTHSRADVRDTANERALSLAEGTPTLILPREDWVLVVERVRADRAVVYYMLSSEKRGMAFSVYINSVPPNQDTASLLSSSLTNPGYKFAKEMSRTEVGPFKAAHFHMEAALPRPVIQTHVQASAIAGGHWFDVHLSKAGQEKPDPSLLLEMLSNIKLSTK